MPIPFTPHCSRATVANQVTHVLQGFPGLANLQNLGSMPCLQGLKAEAFEINRTASFGVLIILGWVGRGTWCVSVLSETASRPLSTDFLGTLSGAALFNSASLPGTLSI